MKRAHFSKLSLAWVLVAAGMAGCGDSGSASDPGGPCQDGTINICQCAPNLNGVQRCQGGAYLPCDCGAPMGTGGGTQFPSSGGFPQGGGTGGPVCGDGNITPPEQCDGQNHNGQDCVSASMGACTGGQLACNGTCAFDLSFCTGCQNGGGGVGGTMGTGGTFGGGGVGGTTGQP